ncbi:MAG: hypothetical protein D6788_05820, partial [Planctomycetota bacterium]
MPDRAFLDTVFRSCPRRMRMKSGGIARDKARGSADNNGQRTGGLSIHRLRRGARGCRAGSLLPAIGMLLVLPAGTAYGGANLIAIGQFSDVPFRRAEGKESLSGGEIVYRFTEPGFAFGRIVVRSQSPHSVVRRDLFVGFTGDGLTIDTRGVGRNAKSVSITSVEFWLRIQGKLQPEHKYEWDLEVAAESNILDSGFPAVVPFFWADGEPIGAEVTIQNPQPKDEDDAIRRLMGPHGLVTLPKFER